MDKRNITSLKNLEFDLEPLNYLQNVTKNFGKCGPSNFLFFRAKWKGIEQKKSDFKPSFYELKNIHGQPVALDKKLMRQHKYNKDTGQATSMYHLAR
jgi:hypothetical protein